MMKLIGILMWLFPVTGWSQALLIPEKSTNLDHYFEKCQSAGYLCTSDYFRNRIINADTPEFQKLVDGIQLSREDYRRELPSKIERLLRHEMIGLEEAETLIYLLKKSQELSADAPTTRLLEEIEYIFNELKKEDTFEMERDEFYIIFKVSLSRSQFKKLRSRLLAVSFIQITPKTVPKTNSLRPEFLATGGCDQTINASYLKEIQFHYQIYFESPCHSLDRMVEASNRVAHFVSENKSPFIAGALAIGIAIFLNHYDVTFN